jgi:hypothetical protein
MTSLLVVPQDLHYDFNFQASRSPERETLVLPGDELLLECQYSTKEREAPTFGGALAILSQFVGMR